MLIRRHFIAVGTLLAVHACAQSSHNQDGLQVLVQALSLNDVGSVEVTVSGVGIPNPLTVPLYPKADGSWSGIVGAIPSGAGRTFTARAFDEGEPSRQIYSGAVADVVIPDRGFVNVAIVMQQDEPNPGFSNHAPVIDELTTSASRADPGDGIVMKLAAHDDDAGETAGMTLVPNARCGGIFELSQSDDRISGQRMWNVRWIVPSAKEVCLLTFLVRDPHGAQALATLSIQVGMGAGTGGARVDTTLQSYPIITDITSTPVAPEVVLRPGGRTTLNVVASHPDGRTLSYRWSCDCAGNLDGAATASPVFTLDAGSQVRPCTFTVLVSGPASMSSDGVEKRLSVAGTLGVSVGNSVPVTELGGPVIDLTSHSSDVAAPGDDVTFVMSARETNPAAHLVSHTWLSSAGILGTPSQTPDLRSGQIVWTAPSNMAARESITVVVTDSQGATASTTYVIDRADPPVIGNVSSTPLLPQLNLVPGGRTALAVSVAEPSGGSVDHAWSSDCPGAFDDVAAAAPVFTLDTAASASACAFSVVVTGPVRTAHDGHTYRLSATGALVVTVGIIGTDPVGGPEIMGVSMSGDMVAPGGSVSLYVGARETNPAAHLTGYAWQASAGTLSSIVSASDLSYNTVVWTAPADMGPWATVDVAVADSQGVDARYTFWIFNATF